MGHFFDIIENLTNSINIIWSFVAKTLLLIFVVYVAVKYAIYIYQTKIKFYFERKAKEKQIIENYYKEEEKKHSKY